MRNILHNIYIRTLCLSLSKIQPKASPPWWWDWDSSIYPTTSRPLTSPGMCLGDDVRGCLKNEATTKLATPVGKLWSSIEFLEQPESSPVIFGYIHNHSYIIWCHSKSLWLSHSAIHRTKLWDFQEFLVLNRHWPGKLQDPSSSTHGEGKKKGSLVCNLWDSYAALG